jgi:hypothetical protein
MDMEFFKNISMTGRLCFLFMCIEKYLVSLYPDRDWTPVAERLWAWTENDWATAQEASDQIIPEYLMEFRTYDETNRRCFDGDLSENLYRKMISLYAGITDGNPDDEINQVLFTTVEWGTLCEGAAFSGADAPTIGYLEWMVSILEEHSIELPDYEAVASMTKDQKNGWGEFCNCRYLSIILK